ncbi:MAG: biotin transporter BioY [Holosporales bacterium]|jgi:biotin transport system substrate-specific component|nr:biotin transporter BioY [Holosporales bacterium]
MSRSVLVEKGRINTQEWRKCLLGAAFVALCTQIAIPTKPVPFTLQTFAVLCLAAKYGPRLGTFSVLFYIVAGALGLPVFSRFGAGLPWLLAPTGGYLLGFIPAVYFTARFLQLAPRKGFWSCFWAGLIGESIIFLCGAGRLSAFVGFSQAYALGIAPFLLTDLLKLIAFAWVARQRTVVV